MSAKPADQKDEDFVSVSIDLPLNQNDLYAYICKVERLFRLNPYLEIKSWQEDEIGNLYTGKNIKVACLNEMNGLEQNLILGIPALQPGKSLSLNYDSGLKQATHYSIEALDTASSRLTIKEVYPANLSVAEKEARLSEVDKSLVPWGEAIHAYFLRRRRWAWMPFYTWFQDVFWLGMSPRHRRITRMILWTTVLEFVVFLFVFVIYWLEHGRAHT